MFIGDILKFSVARFDYHKANIANRKHCLLQIPTNSKFSIVFLESDTFFMENSNFGDIGQVETAHLLSRLTFRIVVSSVSAHDQLRMGPDHQIARAEASQKISQFLVKSNGISDGDLIVRWGY